MRVYRWGYCWLLMGLLSSPVWGQINRLKNLNPDDRVRWLWQASKPWLEATDSLPVMRSLDSVETVAHELSDERLLWYARFRRILCRAFNEDRSHQPITSYQGFEAFVQACPIPSVRAAYYCFYGRWCYSTNQQEKGMRYILRARRMFEQIGYANVPEGIEYLSIFGHYYYYLEDYPQAIYFLKQVRQSPHQYMIMPYAYMTTMGMAYQRLKQYPQAIQAFREGLALARTRRNESWVGICSGSLGAALHLMGKNREALPYLYTELALNTRRVPHTAAASALYLARALMDLDSIGKAGRLIAQSRQLRGNDLSTDYLLNYYETQTHYYKQIGAYQQASLYQDSTLLLTNKQRDLTRSTVLNNAENSIRAEQYLSNIQQTENDKQNALLFRNVLLAMLAIIIIPLIIIAWQYRSIRRVNAQLAGQNQLIADKNNRLAEQADQLRTLMRELHHRVKNNLAIVSSLLNLQSYQLTDHGAIEAVQESQRRVEAMSLIHQRLYRTDGITTINMADFITDLVESLMAAYGYNPDTFGLSITVTEPELDVDVAIPLGLVLNELLTNSFKYAFRGRPLASHRLRPQLRIALHQAGGLTLEVEDNGPGLNLNQWRNADPDTASFGRQLIWSLVEQMDSTLTIDNRPGAYFQIRNLTPFGQ